MAVELALAEKTAAVPTAVMDRVGTSTVAHYPHWRTVGVCGMQLPLAGFRARQDRRPVSWSKIEGGLVDPDAADIGHMPAE